MLPSCFRMGSGELIVDDGSENKGEVERFAALHNTNLEKLVAQVDIVESNSMVEAANRILKYEYLFPKNIQTIKQLGDAVAFYQEDFNARSHGALYGLNPMEVLGGKIPDKRRFKNEMTAAKQKRIGQNQMFDCQIIKQVALAWRDFLLTTGAEHRWIQDL